MKSAIRIFITLLAISFSTPSFAGATWGTITNIYSMSRYGVVIFNQTGTRASAPGCQGAGLGQRWAFKVDTSGGQAMLQTLLSAYVSGRRIWVDGTGNCSAWGDTETVAFFKIED